MYMNERTTHEPCKIGYIGSTASTACWIAIPYQYHQITMVNNPMTGNEIGILRTLFKWKRMNLLTLT